MRPLHRKRVLVAAAVAIGLLALAIGLDIGTASPDLCMSCHEMESRAGSWQQSAHVTVPCVKCHQPPRPWYALPSRLVDRAQLLSRDIGAHLSGEYSDPVETSTIAAEPITDDVCLQCHSPNRTATSGYRILIDHAEHAKRNGSCVSCHIRTAHPLESRGTALTLMAQCFTCHGTPDSPDASSECGTCHPSGYELVPSSHADDGWTDGRHGSIATADLGLCDMCHTKSLCDTCHGGIDMPHPKTWVGSPGGHSSAAKADPDVCLRCHSAQTSICTMCHHSEQDPSRGSWIEQHGDQATNGGAVGCLECHGPLECVECHIGKRE